MNGLKGWIDMKCNMCGGSVLLHNGIYICQSCHNSFSIESVYEHIDVFIAYIENDEQGRRTKDSVIAQNIYNKLKEADVDCFYQRLSVAEMFGKTAESIIDFAVSSSKIIVVVGTTREAFNSLIQKYGLFFDNKKLIPVYSDIDTRSLPQEFSTLQALNYNSIGAGNDLIKSVSDMLNKNTKYDVKELNNKIKNKKKHRIVLFIILLTLIVTGGVCACIFGFANALPSKKYKLALKEVSQNNYAKAIAGFSGISDYKDSKSQLKQIYNQYNGYYYNAENNITLHINISENIKAIVEIKKTGENGSIVITESSMINLNTISFEFNDSENNQGNVEITLLNDDIVLNVNTVTKSDSKSFENVNITFDVKEKSDKPITNEPDDDVLKKWFSKKQTLRDIKAQGYDLRYIGGDMVTRWSSYKIDNTDIVIDFMQGEFSDYNNSAYKNEQEHAYVFTVPAESVIPDKIGSECKPFVSDNILYFPNGYMYSSVHTSICFGIVDEGIINRDTFTTCLPKALISNEMWDSIVKDYLYTFYLNREYLKISNNTVNEIFDFIAENEDCYLTTTRNNFNDSTTPVFEINKHNYNVEFVGYFPYENVEFTKIIKLEDYPEYFSDFLR